jgi:predicted NUDIX family NTP pyrophosphohydrolase
VAKRSAGILLYRLRDDQPEVLLVHPGGPFWAKRDLGAWSLPKGEYEEGEDPRACAIREFSEELGVADMPTDLVELGVVRQAGGKEVTAWAARGDVDPSTVSSNTFTMEWPPRSGELREFPEVDRAEWVDSAQAREKLIPAQAAFVDRLLAHLRGD